MPRKKHQSHPNHERWLVSYADFITLLFAFFVVMFATAQTDNAKTRAVSESVKKALQGDSFKSAFSMLLGGSGDMKGQGIAQQAGSGGPKQSADLSSSDAGRPAADFVPSAATRDPQRPPLGSYDITRPHDQFCASRAVSIGRR